VTRGLRARLSYASYKASNNVSHVPLRELETRSHSQLTASTTRVAGTKRKAPSSTNYYSNPRTTGAAALSRSPMAPPPGSSLSLTNVVTDTRANISNVNGTHGLYASFLVPPPTKQARTILNAHDPPLAAPARPYAPRARRGSRSSDQHQQHTTTPGYNSVGESTRSHQRRQTREKPSSMTTTEKGKTKASPRVQSSRTVSREDDLKAAATLTSLLLHKRPSASLGSPQPTLSGILPNELGSMQHLFPHFLQSSTRTDGDHAPADGRTSGAMGTPPRPEAPGIAGTGGGLTPRTKEPTDDEAAGLMLYLATSPSPARPQTIKDREASDMAAFRTLNNGPSLRTHGRVLFAGDTKAGEGTTGQRLGRSGGSSYNSSLASISDFQMADDTSSSSSKQPRALGPAPTIPVIEGRGEGSSQQMQSSQLLLGSTAHPSQIQETMDKSWTMTSPKSSMNTMHGSSPSQGMIPFNLHDFINVSPSPAVTNHQTKGTGLRADIGRKLFEDEMQKSGAEQSVHLVHERTDADSSRPGRGTGLGAGINLLRD
jgi:hypothetical protein